jgi:hypothetical protein
MTTYFDPTLVNSVTQTVRPYLVNFDINSMYSYVISDVLIDDLFDIKFTKAHYQHFVRLYNRKRYHSAAEIIAAGYTHVKTKWSWDIAADDFVWCTQNLKQGSFVTYGNHFYFACESDAVLFKMHWL